MPLNYATREQVSGYRFLVHRLSVAVARRSVRLIHDPSGAVSAALLVSAVVAVLILVGSFILSYFKPAGQIANSQIVADRATGALYVNVGGVMHPALNLASARLIAGQAENPKFVPGKEIRQHPVGPMVGIVGAPQDLSVRRPAATGWSVCDRLGSTGSLVVPKVAVISGLGQMGDWAHDVVSPQAALMSYGGHHYIVADGHRSEIDLTNRPVTLALGLQPRDLHPAPMSRALYEALTPTPALRVPDVPTPGGPVGYSKNLVSGSVARVKDVNGRAQFFVALPAGVQQIPETVATMIRNAGIAGGQIVEADADDIAKMPQATGFDVRYYPPVRVQLIDKSAEPVTCVMWRKDAAEPQARVTVVSGRRLPIPVGGEDRIVRLVNAGPLVADEVWMAPDAANFVQVTGVEPASPRTESLWWVSDNGVRFGVQTAGQDEQQTRAALGLEGPATPAPWAVIRWLPAGPALSRAAALTEHDTLPGDQSPAELPIDKAGG